MPPRNASGQFAKVRQRMDLHPQWLRLPLITESAANTFTEGTVATPLLTEAGYVMEILKIFAVHPMGDQAATEGIRFAVYDRTKTSMPNFTDNGVLKHSRYQNVLTTSGGLENYGNHCDDYTDGNGNGVLYGKKNIYAGIQGQNQASPLTLEVAILYRLVKVDPEELISLIASD